MDVLGIVDGILVFGLAILCGLLFMQVDSLRHKHKYLLKELTRQGKEIDVLNGRAAPVNKRDQRKINVWTLPPKEADDGGTEHHLPGVRDDQPPPG